MLGMIDCVCVYANSFYLMSGLACRTHRSVDNVADLCFHHTHDVLVHENYSMVLSNYGVVVCFQHKLCSLHRRSLHVDVLPSRDGLCCHCHFWRLDHRYRLC